MASQQKLLRIFRLIRLLNTTPYKTVPQLSVLLDTTPRSVYRYLDFLGEVGYLLDKDAENRYFIIQQTDQRRDQFLEPDEAYFLQDILQQVAPDHPLGAGVIAKLNKIQTLIPAAGSLPNLQNFQRVKQLVEAIRLARRVYLRGYHSASSQKVRDRYVEPIHFDEDYTYLLAYDLEAQENRQFKVDRIASVELSDEAVEKKHAAMPVDLFGFSGAQWHSVRLRMSTTAYRLLIEDHPAARPFIHQKEGAYYFEGQVRDWRGIGRFVLGLPGEIEILAPEELRTFLRQEIQRYSF
jgi:predicted DNA-binding transcriptional regulator YafY